MVTAAKDPSSWGSRVTPQSLFVFIFELFVLMSLRPQRNYKNLKTRGFGPMQFQNLPHWSTPTLMNPRGGLADPKCIQNLHLFQCQKGGGWILFSIL
jgi:hypothetical protein